MYSQVAFKKVNSVKTGSVHGTSIGGINYRKVTSGGYAQSVYAGAGGLGTRVSGVLQHTVHSGSPLQHGKRETRIFGNEKETMNNLNDRLASYIDKVHSLEESNVHLEAQIRDWYSKNTGNTERNDDHNFQVIKDLRNQIISATVENATITLKIDNTRLAADDFRIKFENEQALRLLTEKDTIELRKAIDQLTLARAELEMQIEGLNEELVYLKKNHTEEVNEIRKQSSGSVDVEVDVAPTVNLGKAMEDMREQYAKMIEKQRLEAKFWFDKKLEDWNEEVHVNTTELEKYRKDLTEVKQTVQNLEIHSQAEFSKKNAAEATLGNVKDQYAMQLTDLQENITHVESMLQQTRRDVNHQISEFTLLLSLKTRLEAEIATYRSLLDGGTRECDDLEWLRCMDQMSVDCRAETKCRNKKGRDDTWTSWNQIRQQVRGQWSTVWMKWFRVLVERCTKWQARSKVRFKPRLYTRSRTLKCRITYQEQSHQS
ncbi:PREDICTED: keratin, type I cytoskeletal 19-like [Nanorana parkeri]|uniref:keratin, type I cytoskeletal 19-like n=1 Tax=Nanorana parkeri TaxID=125878 RepID=UPI000854B7A8|nr:PREDICTED: keratin, type I cytoskeletal 19-like [Nanorana parkeri]